MDTPLEVPKETPAGSPPPPKYVRTFAGDMETVQKGGAPDLAPLPTRGTPLERIVAPSPIPETPPEPIAAAPASQPVTPAYAPPPPAESPLQTYGGDFLDHVKETDASPATLLAAEQDAAAAPVLAPAAAEKRGNIGLIAGGVALLLLGIGGAGYAFLRYAPEKPVVTQTSAPTPIFVDEREEISGSPIGLLGAIAASAKKPITTGSIRLLHASTTVFTALPLAAPGILTRNVSSEGSMAGIVSVNGAESPFFILSVSSYSETFAGMLSWEAVMARDLAPLYPAYPAAVVTTATTTSATSSPPVPASAAPGTSSFHDEVVANHDVRVYRDASGKSVFLYGYWDQKTLVIARDPAAFAEIAGRLATSRSR